MAFRRTLPVIAALLVALMAFGCSSASKEGPKVLPKKFPGQGATEGKADQSGPPSNK